jgi:hypothetical protein
VGGLQSPIDLQVAGICTQCIGWLGWLDILALDAEQRQRWDRCSRLSSRAGFWLEVAGSLARCRVRPLPGVLGHSCQEQPLLPCCVSPRPRP